jgi:hypothetical protein
MQPKNINVNVNDCTDIVCPECGCQYWTQAVMVKKLPSLLSPTGKEEIIPMPIYLCQSCKCPITAVE